MAKGLVPVFFTASGVVMAGLIGYGILQSQTRDEASVVDTQTLVEQSAREESAANTAENESSAQEPAPSGEVEGNSQSQAEPQKTIKLSRLLGNAPKNAEPAEAKSDDASKPQEEVASLQSAEESPSERPLQPVFDVIRVERDGNAVIAGKGMPKSKITLMDKSDILAQTNADNNGEFVIVLDEPLASGGHELFLRSEDEGGQITNSQSFAFVDIPERGEIGDVTVLLAEAGKATKLLQKPVAENAIEDDKLADGAVEETQNVQEGQDNNDQEKVASLDEANASPQEEDKKQPVEIDLKPVLIEAADIEGGKIFIAGTGEPQKMVTLYFENSPLGSVRIADNGAFLFEGQRDIAAGRYSVRADMTEPGSTRVLARAEVSLLHEPETAAVKPEDDTKPDAKDNSGAKVEIASKEAEPSEDTLAELVDKNVEEDETVEQKPEIRTGSAVIIRRGDSLWTVARRNYGAGIRYTTIFEANRDQIRNPHRIFPGQVLKVPENETEVNGSDTLETDTNKTGATRTQAN